MTNLQHTSTSTKAQRQRWANQSKIVFAAFFEKPKTMYMVERDTQIMRPSICRFVAVWKKKDSIRVVHTAKDPYTQCSAQFLSTNPIHWPKEGSQNSAEAYLDVPTYEHDENICQNSAESSNREPVKIDRHGQTLMFQ